MLNLSNLDTLRHAGADQFLCSDSIRKKDGNITTLCSLRWHYPDQVPGVDTPGIEAYPLSRKFSSPNTLLM